MTEPTFRIKCRKCSCERFDGEKWAAVKTCANCGESIRVPVVRLTATYTPASVECPYCGSGEQKIKSTQGRNRYHTCQTCKAPYTSVERVR